MPTLPDPNQLNRVSIQPRGRIASAQAGVVESATAQAAFGKSDTALSQGRAVSQFGAEIGALAARRQQELENIMLDDAGNKLRDAETNLSIGEKGYRQDKLGATMRPEYLDNHAKSFDKAATDIELSLNTPEQKARYKREIVAPRRSEFSKSVLLHAADESDKYISVTEKAKLESLLNYGRAQYENPTARNRAVQDTRDTILNQLVRQGLDPNDPANKDVVDSTVLEATGGVVAGMIDAARANGNLVLAQELFSTNYSPEIADEASGTVLPGPRNMTAKQADAVAARLQPDVAREAGRNVAQSASEMVSAGFSNKDVERFIQEETKPHGKGAYDAAKSFVREIEEANTKDLNIRTGDLMDRFNTTGGNTASMNAIESSEEYKSLPGVEKKKIHDYMDTNAQQVRTRQRQEARETQSDTREEDRAAKAELEAKRTGDFGLVMADKAALAALSYPEIARMRLDLGPVLGNKVEAEYKALKAGIASVKISKTLLDDAMPPAVLKDKAKRVAYHGFVESLLSDWKAANPDRKPTEDEQRAIVLSANKTYVAVDQTLGFIDREYPGYAVPEDVKVKWTTKLIEHNRAKGIILTPAQIEKSWRKNLLRSSTE